MILIAQFPWYFSLTHTFSLSIPVHPQNSQNSCTTVEGRIQQNYCSSEIGIFVLDPLHPCETEIYQYVENGVSQ